VIASQEAIREIRRAPTPKGCSLITAVELRPQGAAVFLVLEWPDGRSKTLRIFRDCFASLECALDAQRDDRGFEDTITSRNDELTIYRCIGGPVVLRRTRDGYSPSMRSIWADEAPAVREALSIARQLNEAARRAA
jgi:hypothetical protein